MTDNIEERAMKCVRDALGPVMGAADFQTKGTLADLGADSLDCVALMMELEEELHCELAQDALSVDSTFADILAVLPK